MLLKNNKSGYTLAEMCMVMFLLGIIAALTVPVLKNTDNDKDMLASFKKFKTTIQDSVLKWKDRYHCFNAFQCLIIQNLQDKNCSNFDQIAQYMNVVERADIGNNSALYWLPKQTKDYLGNDESSDGTNGVSQASGGLCRYLLTDGTTLSVNPNPTGFSVLFDVNGIKPPNRIGRDTFPLTIGYMTSLIKHNDINYFAKDSSYGVCGLGENASVSCNATNLNPNVDNGASPTTYVIMNQKIPDKDEIAGYINQNSN